MRRDTERGPYKRFEHRQNEDPAGRKRLRGRRRGECRGKAGYRQSQALIPDAGRIMAELPRARKSWDSRGRYSTLVLPGGGFSSALSESLKSGKSVVFRFFNNRLPPTAG